MGYRGVMSKPKLLGYAEVSARLGVEIRAVRTYLAKARAHRAAGDPRPGDMPEPDLTVGRSPAWLESTIVAWEKRRPGQGVGPRRKRTKGGN